METRATIKNHPLVIVLSPECDLEWDYQARKDESVQDTKMMSHVLLCDLEDRAVLWQTRIVSSDHDRRVKANRDERYHFLRTSQVDGGGCINDFYIDFKRLFALPTEYLVEEIKSPRVERCGYLSSPWVQHLTQRFTFFLGRVGLPDE